MSNNLEFRCPVCRASQRVQESCRRCKADLRLVIRAHRRAVYLYSEIQKAQASGNQQREEILTTELQWLAPKRQ